MFVLAACLSLTSCDQKPPAESESVSEEPVAEERKEASSEEDARAAARKAKLGKMNELAAKSGAKPEAPKVAAKKVEEPVKDELSEEQWKVIEDKMVARNGAKGSSLGEFETSDGRKFEEVVVKDATSIGITAYHKAGIDELDYADMPANLQAMFLYDPDEAAAAMEGKQLPALPAARKREVEKRIGQRQMDLAQAGARALQAEQAEKTKLSREASAKIDAAVAKRKKAADALGAAEDRLVVLEEAAEVARFGPKNARVKKAGNDTIDTRAADGKVAAQRQAIEKARANLEKIEEQLQKLRDAKRIGS